MKSDKVYILVLGGGRGTGVDEGGGGGCLGERDGDMVGRDGGEVDRGGRGQRVGVGGRSKGCRDWINTEVVGGRVMSGT